MSPMNPEGQSEPLAVASCTTFSASIATGTPSVPGRAGICPDHGADNLAPRLDVEPWRIAAEVPCQFSVALHRGGDRRRDGLQVDDARCGASLLELRLGGSQALAQRLRAEPARDGVHDAFDLALQLLHAPGIDRRLAQPRDELLPEALDAGVRQKLVADRREQLVL